MYKYVLFLFSAFVITTKTWSQNNLPITFYNHPVSNSKDAGQSSFKSSEYIYGFVELGTTVKNFFKIPDVKEKFPYPSIRYELMIQFTDKYNTPGRRDNYNRYLLLTKEVLEKTYLQIDVLPDPSLATQVLSGTANFSSALGTCPLYNMLSQEVLNKSSTLPVSIELTLPGTDAWGNEEAKEKWPRLTGSFNFIFQEADVPLLLKNKALANSTATTNAFKLSALPPVFLKPYKAADAKLSQANVLAAIKKAFPERTILKMALESNSSTIWKIMTNDLGIPRYRYYDGVVHLVFKEDGGCWVGEIELEEPYLGGGKYGKLTASSTPERDKIIECAVVK
jgi:hypothetical protein